MDTESNFWGIEFPLPIESESEASLHLLECSGCKDRQPFHHGEVESDVFESNSQIVRYCKRCDLSTIWKLASCEVYAPATETEKRRKSISGLLAKPKPVARRVDRRRRIRAKVHVNACVRYCGSESIVECEDMSRGGLRFTSSKRYYENSLIEVSAPYTKGMPSSFVSAEIVYVLELPERNLFRCGVAYNGVF